MTPYQKISKLNELRNKLTEEISKEVKDMVVIQKLQGQILQLGLTLTRSDIISNGYGQKYY
jgi:uncharacterized protein YdaL